MKLPWKKQLSFAIAAALLAGGSAQAAITSPVTAGSGETKVANDEVNIQTETGYAILSKGGTVYVNADDEDDGSALGNKVNVTGNIGALDNRDSAIYFNLYTRDSSWTGVADNNFGKDTDAFNIIMEIDNNAKWTNESHGDLSSSYTGSYVTELYSKKTSKGAAEIYQKDSKPLTIGYLNGWANVYYDHTGDGTKAADYSAGDVIIGNANTSQVTIATNNTGIDVNNKSVVNQVLTQLANKLVFTQFGVSGNDLAGKVKIADGLTASSQELASGDVTFGKDGRGTYVFDPEQTGTAFSSILTGVAADDAEYEKNGVLRADGTYKFTKDSTITAVAQSDASKAIGVGDLANATVIDASGTTLTLNGTDQTGLIHVLEANNKKGVTINADKLVINASSKGRSEAISIGGQGGSDKSNPQKLTINGDVEMHSKSMGGEYVLGVYAAGNSEFTVNGNMTMKGNNTEEWGLDNGGKGFGYYSSSALYSGSAYSIQQGAKIKVNGNVDFKINGNGLMANGGYSFIDVAGGTIEVNKDNPSGYFAIRAESGTANMNVISDEDGNATGSAGHKVNILGNIGTTAGALNSNEPNKVTVVSLGLDTKDSTWTGVSYNAFNQSTADKGFTGDVNLWLSNGATWTNETWGMTPKGSHGGSDFDGSKVTHFHGGKDAASAGNIFQNDTNALSFQNYEGFTNVYYAHEGDGTAAENYAAGDTVITKAAAGSGISLITDNSGITMTDDAMVGKVLNALAGKLTYTAYTTGEKNVAGTVKIADGLTASSQTLKTGDITFDETTGKGSYVNNTPVPPTSGTYSETITGVASSDTAYKDVITDADTGSLRTYQFKGDTEIKISDSNAAVNVLDVPKQQIQILSDGALKLTVANQKDAEVYGVKHLGSTAAGDVVIGSKSTEISVNGTGTAYGVYADSGEAWNVLHLYFRDGANKEGSGAADLHVNVSGKDAVGIFAQSKNEFSTGAVSIDGNLTMKGTNGSWGVDGTNSAKGIYAAGGSTDGEATVTVKGESDLSVNGTALMAEGAKGKIDLQGKVNILTNKDNGGVNYAAVTDGGTINLNSGKDLAAKDVTISGNLGFLDNGGTINLNLATGASKLSGAVFHKGDKGTLDMTLANGASWTNEAYGVADASFAGSRVTSLAGGADAKSAGHIFQRDSHALTVDSYSGWTNVFYSHEGDGTEASQYKAGDTIITKAAAGSGITLVTDNSGNISVSDKTKVDALLNALAGKLVYSAFATGEKNLTGSVKLADGLTASSKELAVGDITFDAATGRGNYGTVTPPATNSFTQVLTGDKAKDTDYAGVIQSDGSYQFTEDSTITVNQMTRSDKIVLDPSYGEQDDVSSAAIQLDKNVKNLTINADKALTLKVLTDENTKAPNATPGILANKLPVYGVYNAVDGGNVTIKAGTLNIQATSDYTRLGAQNNKIISPSKAYGLYAVNSNGKETSHIQVTGDVNIQAKGFGNVYGIDAEGNSAIHIAGNVTMKGENGAWGIDTSQGVSMTTAIGKYLSAAAVRSYGDGSSVTVDGNVDIASQGAGLTALGGGTVNVAGGTILTENNSQLADGEDISNSAYHYAIAADLGTVNMNMNADKTGSGSQTVKLSGNVGLAANVSGQGYTGASKSSVVNLGLSGKDSTWTGLAVDGISKDQKANGYSGTFNLYLNNGATWTNESYGTNVSDFAGSHVTKLAGGANQFAGGNILQKDSHTLTIDTFSGFATLYYAHEGDGTKASDYTAGDTIIGSAVKGANLGVFTDNSGNIDVNDKDTVGALLNALAGKLIYSAYVSGETNLHGIVSLSDGLTASRQTLKWGDISFDKTTGRGYYADYNPTPTPPVDKNTFTTRINESLNYGSDERAVYDKAGIRKTSKNHVDYTFSDNTTLNIDGSSLEQEFQMPIVGAIQWKGTSSGTIDMTGHKLTLNMDGKYAQKNSNQGIYISSETLTLKDLAGLDINVTQSSGTTRGISVIGTSRNGSTYYDGDGNAYLILDNDDAKEHAVKIRLDPNATSQTGIYVSKNTGTAKLEINGLVDVLVEGDQYARGLVSYGADNVYIGGGKIVSTRGESVLGDHIRINAKLDSNGHVSAAEGTRDVQLEGNVWGGSDTAIAFNTKDSYLKGGANNGVKMLFANGATWTNQPNKTENWTGSAVDEFVGGTTADTAGHIFQIDSKELKLNTYSGFTNVYYAHEGDGTAAENYKAGDTIINKAMAGSGISLITDNSGINMNDDTLVGKVLNALAGKLTYTAYITGEKNLTGTVKIADGLTASSQTLKTGDITFDETTGKGGYKTTPVAPDQQVTTDFTTILTGERDKDTEYITGGVLRDDGTYKFTKDSTITAVAQSDASKAIGVGDLANATVIDASGTTLTLNGTDQTGLTHVLELNNKKGVTITADKLVINASSKGRSEAISIGGQGLSDKLNPAKLTINGDVEMTSKSTGGNYALGVYAAGNSQLTVNGNMTMKGSGDSQWGLDNGEQGWGYYASSALYSGSAYGIQMGASINVNGNVDFKLNGNGLFANGGYSFIDVAGGSIEVNKDNTKNYFAIRSESGTVSMNVTKDTDGNATGAAGNKVNILGNIGVTTGAVNPNEPQKVTTVNLGLNTKDSSWTGVSVNDFGSKGTEGFTGVVNVWLANGASWTNEAWGSVAKTFAGSAVDNLYGGDSEANAGNIFQNDTNKLTLGNYSGYTNVFYAHTGDGTTAESYAAGDTVITKAAAGSGISLITDNSGITMTDTDQVKKALNALAGKLTYTAYTTGEKNLTGTVKIADGLTSSSKVQKYGDISFDKTTGQGSMTGDVKPEDKPVQPDPDQPGGDNKPSDKISEGDYETYVMKGIRSAATTNMHAWRDNVSDLYDASDLADEDGIFAKVLGGKTEANTAGIHEDNSYWGGQVGYDKKVANGWHTGIAFDYRDGDSTYLLGGTGDDKLYSLGIYAKKAFDNGSHVKVALKAGQVENDYTVYNEIRTTALGGKYKASAVGLTAEYGKTYGSDHGYFMPKVQMSWSRVGSDDYTARTAGGATIDVHQDAYTSLVGRLGFEAGSRNARGRFYAGLNLAHEFDGDINSGYYAKDGGAKKTSYEGKDTWLELVLGGRYQLSENTQFYADFARDFGGDFEHKWKLNAGLKWSF